MEEVYFLNGSGFMLGTIIKETNKKYEIAFEYCGVKEVRKIFKSDAAKKNEKVLLFRNKYTKELSVFKDVSNTIFPFEVDIEKGIGVYEN